MNSAEWILIEDICRHYKVEYTFVQALNESELIHLKMIEKQRYLPLSEINEFEKMRRLHYEMDINLEGLEAIQNLLETVQQLQRENRQLRNRLRLYE